MELGITIIVYKKNFKKIYKYNLLEFTSTGLKYIWIRVVDLISNFSVLRTHTNFASNLESSVYA